MIEALVSGQSGTAVLSRDNSLFLLSIDDEEPSPVSPESVHLLFADATDLTKVQVSDTASLVERVKDAWTQDRALQLVLIVLDPESEPDIRAEAALAAEELLADRSGVREFLRARMFSRPLPGQCDVTAALAIAEGHATEIGALLREVIDRQDDIGAAAEWFDALPATTPEEGQRKADLRARLETIMPALLTADDRLSVDALILDLVQEPAIRAIPNYRLRIQELRERLRGSHRHAALPDVVPDPKEPPARERREWRRPSADEAKARVDREKSEIVRRIEIGQDDLAKRYAAQLIDRQLATDKNATHVVMTLCDLAKHAKYRGRPDLHLYFAQYAVQIGPNDGIARSQLADAYLSLSNYSEALKHYRIAETLTNNDPVPINGQGDVLKLMGDFGAAIAEYDRALSVMPDNEVAISSKAELLKEWGRTAEALDLIEGVLAKRPLAHVFIAVHAGILKEIERYDEAIREYRFINEHWPDDLFGQAGLADALRRAGQIDESIAVFRQASKNFPFNAGVHGGLGEALKRKGDYESALAEYDVALKLGGDMITISGRAGVLRRMGRFDEALQNYEEALRLAPYNLLTHVGKASTLLRMRRPDQALAVLRVLPAFPTTRAEWYGEYVRAMALIRNNDLSEAHQVLTNGFKVCPLPSIRHLFLGGGALVEVRRRAYQHAIRSVNGRSGDLPDIIRLHAFGAVQNHAAAKAAYRRLQKVTEPEIAAVRDSIAALFLFRNAAAVNEEALFEVEVDLFAEAA